MSIPPFADEPRGPWLRRRGVVLDVGIVVVGLLLVGAYYGLVDRGSGPQPVPGVLAALQLLPLVVRRVRPGACLVAVAAFGALQVLVVDQPTWGQVAVPITVYSVAAYGERSRVVAALVLGLAGAVAGPLDWFVPDVASTVAGVAFCAVVVVAAAAVGLLGRTRAAYVGQLIERGVRLERESAQQAELAASDERARIAREMHDVVAHGLSVMVVQADGASYQLEGDPKRAGRALDTIATTGRDSLQEMRRMLGLLRAEDGATGTRPQPGLADLAFLLEQDPGPGIVVEAQLPDDLPEVDRGVGLTAYRIVQEALTNVRKHAGPGVRVQVEVSAVAGALVLRVRDDGRGAATASGPDGPGHGILGMRERVAVHGGEMEAGPRPGGGFEVHARVPFDTSSREDA